MCMWNVWAQLQFADLTPAQSLARAWWAVSVAWPESQEIFEDSWSICPWNADVKWRDSFLKVRPASTVKSSCVSGSPGLASSEIFCLLSFLQGWDLSKQVSLKGEKTKLGHDCAPCLLLPSKSYHFTWDKNYIYTFSFSRKLNVWIIWSLGGGVAKS